MKRRSTALITAVMRLPAAIRRVWREGARDAWRDYRALVFVLVVVGTLVVGSIGLHSWSHAEPQRPHYSWPDSTYRAFAFFGFNGGDVEDVPWSVQIARFVAPLLLIW